MDGTRTYKSAEPVMFSSAKLRERSACPADVSLGVFYLHMRWGVLAQRVAFGDVLKGLLQGSDRQPGGRQDTRTNDL